MMRSINPEVGRIKRVVGGLREGEKGVYLCFSKSILMLFARAGSTKRISFFLLIIGLKG
jgi:hypothetical protein